jgi:hypothetical protein
MQERKIYIIKEDKTPCEKTISVRLSIADFYKLENLKKEFKENYSGIIRNALRKLYKEKGCTNEKNKKTNSEKSPDMKIIMPAQTA